MAFMGLRGRVALWGSAGTWGGGGCRDLRAMQVGALMAWRERAAVRTFAL